MAAESVSDISDFACRSFTFDGAAKPVLCLGDEGPAVILIHEISGFTHSLARLCRSGMVAIGSKPP
jgi:hypothetical protein